MSGFFRSLPLVLGAEGGLVNDPNDRGGLTNHGVTQVTYHRWRDHVGQPRRSVELITPDEVQAIYYQFYWLRGQCDALPWPASHLHFDACVNHGVHEAVRLLQRAAGVKDDGAFGPLTRSAVDRAHTSDLCQALLWQRVRFYVEISADPSQLGFLRGWLNRVLNLREVAA